MKLNVPEPAANAEQTVNNIPVTPPPQPPQNAVDLNATGSPATSTGGVTDEREEDDHESDMDVVRAFFYPFKVKHNFVDKFSTLFL